MVRQEIGEGHSFSELAERVISVGKSGRVVCLLVFSGAPTTKVILRPLPGRVIVRKYRKEVVEGCIWNSESGMRRETTLQLNKRGYQGAFLFQQPLYDR